MINNNNFIAPAAGLGSKFINISEVDATATVEIKNNVFGKVNNMLKESAVYLRNVVDFDSFIVGGNTFANAKSENLPVVWASHGATTPDVSFAKAYDNFVK